MNFYDGLFIGFIIGIIIEGLIFKNIFFIFRKKFKKYQTQIWKTNLKQK